MPSYRLFALGAALALATPASASASSLAFAAPAEDAPAKVGTLPLEFGKDVGKRMRGSLEDGLSEGLGRALSDVNPIEGREGACDRDCQEQLASENGYTHVVSGEVSKDGPDFRIVLSALEAGSNADPITVEGSCEICGESELAEQLADLSANLATRIQDSSAREATLQLSGKPSGATIFVDGEEVGRAPLEFTFEPGTHEIEIRKPGFDTQVQTWTATEGVSDKITFDLQRTEKRRTGRTHIVRPLGFALGGAGVGMIAAGAVLLSLDGKDHQSTCTDDLLDVDGDCPFRYATKAPGIGLLVGGVVAAAGGAGLVTWTYLSDGKKEAEARLDVTPRGAVATLRF